jgi:dihydrofolate reductase
MTKIKLIAAISRYRGIGKNNQLPWNHKTDLKFFYDNTVSTLKKKRENNTYSNAVFMGSNTFNSLPKLLKYRDHIVISRKSKPISYYDLNNEINNNITHVESIQKCIDLARYKKYENLWCIGGSQIYESALRVILFDEIKLTFINHPYDCDTYFPELPEIYQQVHDKTVIDNGKYISFLTYIPKQRL